MIRKFLTIQYCIIDDQTGVIRSGSMIFMEVCVFVDGKLRFDLIKTIEYSTDFKFESFTI